MKRIERVCANYHRGAEVRFVTYRCANSSYVRRRTTQPFGWRFTNEAPEHRAHFPALANPRDRPRLPAGGRVGAADAGRPGRLASAGAADRRGRSVEKLVRRRPCALDTPVEGRGAARLGPPGRRPGLQG